MGLDAFEITRCSAVFSSWGISKRILVIVESIFRCDTVQPTNSHQCVFTYIIYPQLMRLSGYGIVVFPRWYCSLVSNRELLHIVRSLATAGRIHRNVYWIPFASIIRVRVKNELFGIGGGPYLGEERIEKTNVLSFFSIIRDISFCGSIHFSIRYK